MNKFLLTLATSLTLTSAAIAGNLDSPATTTTYVAPVAASVTDWSGLYVGGMASFNSGDFDYFVSGVFDSTLPMEGDMYGGFVGYNIQRGSIVFGGEVAYSAGSTFLTGFPTYEFSTMLDVKARVGYAAGRALIFGVAGGSYSPWDNGFDSNFDMFGFNVGAGVDYLVTDNIFVGAEYLMRFLSGDDGVVINSYEANIQSIQVRAGWKF